MQSDDGTCHKFLYFAKETVLQPALGVTCLPPDIRIRNKTGAIAWIVTIAIFLR